MGSLSGLYISQSYQSLLHLASDTVGFSGSNQSAFLEIQDGLGNGTQVFLNTTGSINASGSIEAKGNISSSTLSGVGNVSAFSASVNQRIVSLESVTASFQAFTQSANIRLNNIENYTSSLRTAFTASGTDVIFSNDITVPGTINAYKIHTTIESSSVIYSSGSNQFGDDVSDTQTLYGTVNVVNTLNVAGVNFASFSQSVDNRLDQLEADSASQDIRLDNLEAFSASALISFSNLNATTASLNTSVANLNTTTASINLSITQLNASSASQQVSIDNLNTTTASINSSLTQLNASSASQQISINNLNTTTASLNTSIASLNSFSASATASIVQLLNFSSSVNLQLDTSSLATTGSNIFRGNQTITGSLILSSSATTELSVIGASTFSGSVNGVVNALSITSNTASMDCSLGNFFTLTLVSGSNTRLVPTNILAGETLSLKVLQASTGVGTISYPSTIKFPAGLAYSASFITGSEDILTFVSYNTASLYATSVTNLI